MIDAYLGVDFKIFTGDFIKVSGYLYTLILIF
jgi:hypothetical protein